MIGDLDAILIIVVVAVLAYLYMTGDMEGFVQERWHTLVPSWSSFPKVNYPYEPGDGRRTHAMNYKAGSPWGGKEYAPEDTYDGTPPWSEWDLRDSDIDNSMVRYQQQSSGENRDRRAMDGHIETNTADYWRPLYEQDLQESEYAEWWGHMDL